MTTPPTSSTRAAWKATCTSRVKTPACRPNRLSFTRAKASSSESTTSTTATGPNTSSQDTRASAGTPVSTVGAYVAPSRVPPLRTRAPADRASSTQDSTRRAADSSISGPTSVAGSVGSPVASRSTASTSRSTSPSATDRWTRTRWTEMQDWLAWYIAKVAIRVAAQASDFSSSWSAPTTTAALPPSSSVTCLRGAASRIDQPTGTDPVNETTGNRGSCTSAAATSFGTGTTDQDPAGRSVSARISPSSSADSGVAGAGLSTIGAPTAIAGATLWATRLSGKLNGAMPSTGPRGARRTSASRPLAAGSVSSRISSPENRLASSAAHRNVDTALLTSPRDHFSGLPFSAVTRAAYSSARAAMRADTWARASARTCAGRPAASCRTASAAATASSTCAGSGTETVARISPVYLSVTSTDSPPEACLPANQNGRAPVIGPPLPASSVVSTLLRDHTVGWLLMTPLDAGAVSPAGPAAGAINTIVGSGSLLTFPTLLAVGYQPVLANVSNSVGLTFGSVSGAVGYRVELKGQLRRCLLFGACTAVGSLTGAILLLALPGKVFEHVV